MVRVASNLVQCCQRDVRDYRWIEVLFPERGWHCKGVLRGSSFGRSVCEATNSASNGGRQITGGRGLESQQDRVVRTRWPMVKCTSVVPRNINGPMKWLSTCCIALYCISFNVFCRCRIHQQMRANVSYIHDLVTMFPQNGLLFRCRKWRRRKAEKRNGWSQAGSRYGIRFPPFIQTFYWSNLS